MPHDIVQHVLRNPVPETPPKGHPLKELTRTQAVVYPILSVVRGFMTEDFYRDRQDFHVTGNHTADSAIILGSVLVPLASGAVFLWLTERDFRAADERRKEMEEEAEANKERAAMLKGQVRWDESAR